MKPSEQNACNSHPNKFIANAYYQVCYQTFQVLYCLISMIITNFHQSYLIIVRYQPRKKPKIKFYSLAHIVQMRATSFFLVDRLLFNASQHVIFANKLCKERAFTLIFVDIRCNFPRKTYILTANNKLIVINDKTDQKF